MLAYFLYRLGVNGPFLLDDFHNLSGIATGGGVVGVDDLLRYLFDADGENYSRFIARLTFVVNDQFWPSAPYGFKLTNIAIHLMNGLLVALLLIRILPVWMGRVKAQRVAILCAGLWLLHPLHVSTTLYVVQRMTQLMMFFALLSLIFYIAFRNAKTWLKAIVSLILAAVAALLSFFSKDNGAILLLLFPLLEWGCFSQNDSKFKYVSRYLSTALGLLFVVVFVAFVIWYLPGFDGRVFSVSDRIQVQGFVLYEYIHYILLPSREGLGIFHDYLEWSVVKQGVKYEGLFWLLHMVIWGIAVLCVRRYRLVTVGIAWFYICHLIESSFIPLELMFEHRNYLASVGPLLIVAYALISAMFYMEDKKLKVVAAMLVIAPVFFLTVNLAHRAALWSDYRILVHKWSVENPNSLRAQYSQVVLLERDGFLDGALKLVEQQEQVFNDITLPLYRIRLECQMNPMVNNLNKLDVELVSKTNYTSGISTAIESLIHLDRMDCVNRQLINGDFKKLIVAVENMPLLKSKGKNYASYLDVIDDYYIKERDYKKAVMTRERLWTVQPTIPVALKLVELYILGGDYESAENYLELAKAKKEQLWFEDTLANRGIERLELIVKAADTL
ncbi:MAG: hypothetical protein WCY88_05490 [Spongiibacteraceae bacterium]